MTNNIKNAINILAAYDPECRLDRFRGSHNRHIRQRIMIALLGHDVPKAQCGINALFDEFCRQAGIPNWCLAQKEYVSKRRESLLAEFCLGANLPE